MHSSRFSVRLLQTYCARMQRPITRPAGRLFACGRWTNTCSAETSSRLYCTDIISPAAISDQDKMFAPKIQQLVDEISQLTLIEVADLNELLKKTLNITDAPMMAMGAMPVQDDNQEPEEKVPEKSSFTVKLTGFDNAKKVAIIKQMKALVAGMNLVQAKKFVESTPQVVRADITKAEAEDLQKALEEVGGSVTIE